MTGCTKVCVHLSVVGFMARQNAMHAERDIVLAIPSVCPSNAGTV